MVVRYAVGLFGLFCGALVVAIVARYGFETASTKIDGYITAAFFAIIAAGGMAGHMVAVRVWRVSRFAAVAIGLVACAALLLNLTTSMGFIAGRDNVNEAKRGKIRQQERRDNAQLDRLVKERGWLPKFTPVTEAGVKAARDAVASAASIREQECRSRGTRCRAREGDEQKVRDRLVKAENGLAMTQRAAKLDSKIEAVRLRLDTVKPVKKEQADASAIASLFKIPTATAETYRLVGLAAVVELLIVMSLIAFELLGQPDRQRKKAKAARKEDEPVELVATPPVHSMPPEMQPAARITKQPKPKQLTVEKGDVLEFAAECLKPAKMGSIPLPELHQAYETWCETEGTMPVEPGEFERQFLQLCEEARIPCNDQEVLRMSLLSAA